MAYKIIETFGARIAPKVHVAAEGDLQTAKAWFGDRIADIEQDADNPRFYDLLTNDGRIFAIEVTE